MHIRIEADYVTPSGKFKKFKDIVDIDSTKPLAELSVLSDKIKKKIESRGSSVFDVHVVINL